LDGYIADKANDLQWLISIPNPSGNDFGYKEFVKDVDCLLMGRNTFEFVVGFGQWPYEKPVFVASSSLKTPPAGYEDKITVVSGTPQELLTAIEKTGCRNVYVDGGALITQFLEDDLIDDMIITRTPQLLGSGYPLFGSFSRGSIWKKTSSTEPNDYLVQTRYERDRSHPAGATAY
jgi:dihydrofolate reductase